MGDGSGGDLHLYWNQDTTPGERTADIMAVLWPERCKAIISVSGYLIGNPAVSKMPLPPKFYPRVLYQYSFATDIGQAGYEKYLHDFAKLIWRTASPKWDIDDATFERFRGGAQQPGPRRYHDPQLPLAHRPGRRRAETRRSEKRLAVLPPVRVPAITMEGDNSGAIHLDSAAYRNKLSGKYEHRLHHWRRRA